MQADTERSAVVIQQTTYERCTIGSRDSHMPEMTIRLSDVATVLNITRSIRKGTEYVIPKGLDAAKPYQTEDVPTPWDYYIRVAACGVDTVGSMEIKLPDGQWHNCSDVALCRDMRDEDGAAKMLDTTYDTSDPAVRGNQLEMMLDWNNFVQKERRRRALDQLGLSSDVIVKRERVLIREAAMGQSRQSESAQGEQARGAPCIQNITCNTYNVSHETINEYDTLGTAHKAHEKVKLKKKIVIYLISIIIFISLLISIASFFI